MKKLVFLLVLLIMIAGGTVSVLQWLEVGPFAKDPSEMEAQAPTAPVDEPPVYLDMPVLIIPVIQEDRVVGTIQIQLKLQLAAGFESEVNRQMPRLNDAFLRDLHHYLPLALERSEGRLDLQAIKARLLRVSDRVLEPGAIKDILVQSVMENPRQ